jgi:hypothetical protein
MGPRTQRGRVTHEVVGSTWNIDAGRGLAQNARPADQAEWSRMACSASSA